MTDIDFPYHYDDRGRTAVTAGEDHVRDLIAQVLFTAPGERVMRPDFGSGLLALTFEPNSPELAATVQFLAQGALQRWLSSRIAVEGVDVSNVEGELRVTVRYANLATGQRAVVELP